MRYFARLLEQLKTTVETTRAGDQLDPPGLLSQVRIRGRRLCYFRMGLHPEGPAVIMLHGFGGFFMDWPRVMVPLAKRYRMFALDLPGWGFSESHEKVEGIEDDAAVVADFIRHHKLDNVLLVGISYGAAVAWATATLQMPEVKQLLLINPMPPEPIKYLKSRLYRLIFLVNRFAWLSRLTSRFMTKSQYKLVCKENLKHFRLLDSLYLELGFRVLRQPSVNRNVHFHAAKAGSIDWASWAGKLAQIRIPTTILQGLEDRVFTMESARHLQSLIPGSTLTPVKDCGHAMIFDQHRKVTTQILRMLKGGKADGADSSDSATDEALEAP